MTDVAREAGVSVMTVSNAYRQPDMVLQKTRERISAAATRLGYIPNAIAGNLASGKNLIVAAIVPSIRNSNFARMLQGLEEHLDRAGYELLLAIAETPEHELRSVQALLGWRPEGIVLTGNTHLPETAALLSQFRTPVVETWSIVDPIIDMAVGFSLHDSAQAIGRLLIEKGYRRIGFAGFSQAQTSRFRERQHGFERALKDGGLDTSHVFLADEALGFASGRMALEALTAAEPKLEALFCITDVLAAGALFECQRRQWPVPERFAVAGFGDFEIAEEIPPGLTTVRTRGYQIGQAAAELIIGRAEGGAAGGRVNVGYELVIRGSV